MSKIVRLTGHLVREKRTKTDSWSRMTDGRTNGVAIINIESDVTKALTHNDVVNELGQLKSHDENEFIFLVVLWVITLVIIHCTSINNLKKKKTKTVFIYPVVIHYTTCNMYGIKTIPLFFWSKIDIFFKWEERGQKKKKKNSDQAPKNLILVSYYVYDNHRCSQTGKFNKTNSCRTSKTVRFNTLSLYAVIAIIAIVEFRLARLIF